MEHRSVYNRQSWRNLPRDFCVVRELLEDAAGPCHGLIHRHHVDPTDPESRSVPVCAAHHPRLHAVLRGLTRAAPERRCTHKHRYDHARRECERRLNRAA